MVDLDQHTDIVRFVVEGCLQGCKQTRRKKPEKPEKVRESGLKASKMGWKEIKVWEFGLHESRNSCKSKKTYIPMFKIWPSTVTPRWPPIKNSWTPWKNLWPRISSVFTQVSSKSIDSCRRRSVLSIFEQWPQMTPRWPLTPNSWTPLLSPTWWSLCPSIMKIHQCIFEKHFLIVNG